MHIKSTTNIIVTLFLVSVIALIVKPVSLSNEQSNHNQSLLLSSSQQQDQQTIMGRDGNADAKGNSHPYYLVKEKLFVVISTHFSLPPIILHFS